MHRDGLIRLLERAGDAAFSLTADARIASWNGRAEQLFGHAARDVLHCRIDEVLHPHGSLGRALDDSYCRQAVRDGGVSSFDLHVVTAVGDARWVSVSALVFDAIGTSPAWIVHLAHDITPHKRQERLLHDLVETAQRIVTTADDGRHLIPVSPLSAAEQRILRALADGASPSTVARDLGISRHTIRNHLHHINHKLGTHNRLQAVIHAMRRKLI